MNLKNFFVLAIVFIGLVLFGACQSNPFGAANSGDDPGEDSELGVTKIYLEVVDASKIAYLYNISSDGPAGYRATSTKVDINASLFVGIEPSMYRQYDVSGPGSYDEDYFKHLNYYYNPATRFHMRFIDASMSDIPIMQSQFSHYVNRPDIFSEVLTSVNDVINPIHVGVCLGIQVGADVNNGSVIARLFVPINQLSLKPKVYYSKNLLKDIVIGIPYDQMELLDDSFLSEFGEVKYYEIAN